MSIKCQKLKSCCLVELSGIGGLASSYATAGITFRSILPHKPHYHNKSSGGGLKSVVVKFQHKFCFPE